MAQYLRSVQGHEMRPREWLFLEVGGGGFPMRRAAGHAAASSERHHRARSASTLANSPAARAGQHVATSQVVPGHQVSLDCVPPERHCYRIVDMTGRNVSVRIHALQRLNLFSIESFITCFNRYGWVAVQGLVNASPRQMSLDRAALGSTTGPKFIHSCASTGMRARGAVVEVRRGPGRNAGDRRASSAREPLRE